MKYLLFLLASCTAAVAPAVKDTVYVERTVYVLPSVDRTDTTLFCVMFSPERYVEYYANKDSLYIAGKRDSVVYGLVRMIYNCK